ncbi:MAG: MerR family transcriptional regulator [Ruminococcaceae bacterium]|nr:MerR family transcriptional regulator [Oscillospiraceae bacterium]
MKIKEAAAKCGLTEKAIRLYEEKGLISPSMTEKNGRQFRDYDEETIRRLQTVASLRKAFFSIEQISEILDHPENIPTVFASYRAELHQKYTDLKPLLEHAENVAPETLTSAAAVSEAMTAPLSHGVSEQALPTLHFRVWDEEQSRDEREIAYARCQQYIAHWGRFYGAYLVFDTVCEWIGRSFRVITAVLAGLIVLALALYYVPLPIRVDTVLTGYEATFDEDSQLLWELRESFRSVDEIKNFDISRLPDPTDAVERTVSFDGWILRYAFRQDIFKGYISISGYESMVLPWSMYHDFDPADMKPADSRFHFSLDGLFGEVYSTDYHNVWLIREDQSALISMIYAHEKNLKEAIQITPASAGYYLLDNGEIDPHRITYHKLGHDRYIFVPAQSIEEAKYLYYEYAWKAREIRIFEQKQMRTEAAK